MDETLRREKEEVIITTTKTQDRAHLGKDGWTRCTYSKDKFEYWQEFETVDELPPWTVPCKDCINRFGSDYLEPVATIVSDIRRLIDSDDGDGPTLTKTELGRVRHYLVTFKESDCWEQAAERMEDV